jgi:hypothetical protein
MAGACVEGFESKPLRQSLGSRDRKYQDGENYIMRSCIFVLITKYCYGNQINFKVCSL